MERMESKLTYAGCGESRDGRPETYAYGRVFCACDACDDAITAMLGQDVPCPECHGEATTCPLCYGTGFLAPIATGETQINQADMSEHLPPDDGRSKFYDVSSKSSPPGEVVEDRAGQSVHPQSAAGSVELHDKGDADPARSSVVQKGESAK